MIEQTFPTIRYHPTEPSRLIASAAELEELDDYVWRDTPYPAPEPDMAPASGRVDPRVNPDLYRLVLRSARGDATSDEHALANKVVVYLMHLSLDEVTPEEEYQETARLLEEFGMPMWASNIR